MTGQTIRGRSKRSCCLSYIVPVHDAMRTIRTCVASLAASQGVSFEVILVENGSTDDSLTVCRDLAESYPMVKVSSLAEADVNKARNHGYELSQGRYVAFVDADDWVLQSFANELVSAAEESGADIVRCGYRRVLSTHAVLHDDRSAYDDRRTETPSSQSTYETLGRFLNPTIHCFTPSGLWGGIYRRELFGSIPEEIRRNDLRRKEDMLVCSHAFVRARKILFLPDYLYSYRYGGVTSTSYRVISDLQRYYTLMVQTHGLETDSDYPRMWREICLYVVETVRDAYFALSAEGDCGIRAFYRDALSDSFVRKAAEEAACDDGELAEVSQTILRGNVDDLIDMLHKRLRMRRIKSNAVRIAAKTGLL